MASFQTFKLSTRFGVSSPETSTSAGLSVRASSSGAPDALSCSAARVAARSMRRAVHVWKGELWMNERKVTKIKKRKLYRGTTEWLTEFRGHDAAWKDWPRFLWRFGADRACRTCLSWGGSSFYTHRRDFPKLRVPSYVIKLLCVGLLEVPSAAAAADDDGDDVHLQTTFI